MVASMVDQWVGMMVGLLVDEKVDWMAAQRVASKVASRVESSAAQTADYSAVCQAESGVTVTYGTAKSGKLAVGTTALTAADICTFSSGKRGSITFTINANIGAVKGVYQQAINGAAAGYIPLERPYGTNTY